MVELIGIEPVVNFQWVAGFGCRMVARNSEECGEDFPLFPALENQPPNGGCKWQLRSWRWRILKLSLPGIYVWEALNAGTGKPR